MINDFSFPHIPVLPLPVLNPLSAGIFTVFGLFWTLLEGRVLHKGAWVATLLGTLQVQDYKKVKFPCTA